MDPLVTLFKIKNAYTYEGYKNLVKAFAENSRTTGQEQLPERIEATKMNAQRMKRIDKQIKINDEVKQAIGRLSGKWTWIVLAESWCGDGAQNIPFIAKIKELSPQIELKILLRDENPEIMERYLTSNSRAIPKLICINSETEDEIGTWGSRPDKIKKMVKEYKASNPQSTHDEFVRNLHLWYARDNGASIQKDFEQLLLQWTSH